MIRIGLLDTTVPGEPGSMTRFREQLVQAFDEHFPDTFKLSVEALGCGREQLDRVPRRFQMWYRHWRIRQAARRLETSRYDLLHLLDGSFGYVLNALSPVATPSPVATMATVHDVIPRLQADGVFPGAPPVGRGACWLIDQSLVGVACCDRVCVDSHSTADDLLRLGCRSAADLAVVPLAVEVERFSGERLAPQDVGLEKPFVFHLGNNGFYKNRAGVIETFAKIDRKLDLMLVLAGPPATPSLRAMVSGFGLQQRVRFVEHPDGEQLSRYYRGAAVFLFPSVYEGFGWPPLEAMAAGCPVVASDAGSLAEVVGDAGLTTDCGDHAGLAAHCERLLTDAALRERQIQAGRRWVARFTTRCLANQMAEQYRLVAGNRSVAGDRSLTGDCLVAGGG